MINLPDKDIELIELAKRAISLNYDDKNFNHTVGAAVRCKNGKVYVGVNVYTTHGACAEMIAIGSAITNGEGDFECIVAVRGKDGNEILPPCGNCRQMLADYMPYCDVVISDADNIYKVQARDLLPYAYSVEK